MLNKYIRGVFRSSVEKAQEGNNIPWDQTFRLRIDNQRIPPSPNQPNGFTVHVMHVIFFIRFAWRMFISSKVNESYVYMYMSLSFYCILFFTSEKALVRRIDFDLHNYNERKPVNFTVPKCPMWAVTVKKVSWKINLLTNSR